MKKIFETFKERFLNESVVKSIEDFEKRLEDGKWEYNKKELKLLRRFIDDLDKKYGKDNHGYGKDSYFAYKYPDFYTIKENYDKDIKDFLQDDEIIFAKNRSTSGGSFSMTNIVYLAVNIQTSELVAYKERIVRDYWPEYDKADITQDITKVDADLGTFGKPKLGNINKVLSNNNLGRSRGNKPMTSRTWTKIINGEEVSGEFKTSEIFNNDEILNKLNITLFDIEYI